jgi:hypothetical protein
VRTATAKLLAVAFALQPAVAFGAKVPIKSGRTPACGT